MADFWISTFLNNIRVDASVVDRASFESFVNQHIQGLDILSATHSRTVIPFISEMFNGNLLPSAFNTDWNLEYGNESNGFLIRSVPRSYMNGTCNCIVSNKCQDALRVGPSDIKLEGLVVGCSPMDGLRMSSLQCFFSSDCISAIIDHLNYYTELDGSPSLHFDRPPIPATIMRPLDKTGLSKSLPNTTIGTLINDLFIESWINSSSYGSYFNSCSPSECRYEHRSGQSILYVITAVLSLYSGLSAAWRIVVWNALRLYQRTKVWCASRRTTVEPF